MSSHSILVLPGDGIGPEVTAEALKIISAISRCTASVTFCIQTALLGGCSIDKHGVALTSDVLSQAKAANAVLMGAVGGPKWGAGPIRPEEGVLALRAELATYANLRPCRIASPSLTPLSALRPDVAAGTDFVVVRENCGGAYFGAKVEEADFASDAWSYARGEVERVARVAGELAMQEEEEERRQVISCDKANVLASSRLWRRVVSDVFAAEFPRVRLVHQLADSAAMLMIKDPRSFNGVVLADNTFGDLLSDVSAVIPGSLGLLPSASLAGLPGKKTGNAQGIYEPVHGSAPDIAGRGIANPVAAILSVAMMFKYSFGMAKEARAIERAVEMVLDAREMGGLELRTADLGGNVSTSQMGDAICDVLLWILEAK